MNHFRYSLVDQNGKYLFLSNNAVLADNTPRYSLNAPFDWADTQIQIERNIVELGLFRTFTLPASFTTEMAQLLRCLMLDKGYEAYAKLVIDKRVNYKKGYQPYAEAEIDFTMFNDVRQGTWTISVNLMDNGLAELIKNIESTVYEISLEESDAITVNMDGIELQNKATWAVTNGTNIANNPTGAHTWDASIVEVESLNQLDVETVEWTNWTNASDFYDKWMYKASTAREITFTWDFTIGFAAVPGASYTLNRPFIQIFKADSSGSGSNTSVFTILDLTSVPPGVFLNQDYHLAGSFTTIPNVGDRFYFSTRLIPVPAGSNLINFNYDPSSTVSLTYFDRVPAFDVKALRFYQVFKKLIERASVGKYTIASNALTNPNASNADYSTGINNIPWHTVLTSGTALRGLPPNIFKPAQTIKITYAQLRDFVRNTWGMGINQENGLLRIEKLVTLFNKDNIALTIEDVAKFRIYAANDLFVSTISIGYEDQTYDILNGLDEFNTTQQYKMPVVRPTKDLKMINSIRADMYGVEYIRYNRYLKDSTDSKFDNNIFALEIEPLQTNGKYNLSRRSGLKAGIVSEDTAYNFGLSPKSCLIRNLPYIYSILPNTVDGTITYQSSAKNGALKTSLGAPPILVSESSDIKVSNYIFKPLLPLFLPYYVDFECSPPNDILLKISANPYSVIQFRYNGNYFKGFIVSVGIKPAKNDLYVFKLLLSPDTDLTLFKNL